MPDRIHIRDLKLRCIIGVYPEERRDKQDIIVNVAMECDCRQAARTDDIADAVDYKGIKKRIVSAVEQSDYELIESLAQRIADLCLESEGVESVTATVDKPGALRFARSVAVEVTRP